MKVSVITVSYNSEKTIKDTIESVLNQDYDDLEYFVIDGASKDRTVEIARSFAEKFSEKGFSYTVISEPDNGIYDAMNKGIRLSCGEIIGIVNSDDYYEPDAVSTVVSVYNDTNFDMFYADLNVIERDKDGKESVKLVKQARKRKIAVSRDWNHPTTFVTRKTYDELGAYKCESLYDDFDLWLRIRKSGRRIEILNKPLSNYRLGGISNHKKLKDCIDRGKARYRIYRNNGYSRFYWFECVLIEGVKFILA